MPSTDKLFPVVQPGDPIKADAWNEITKQLIALGVIGDAGHVIATGAGIFRRGRKATATTTSSSGGAQPVEFTLATVDCEAGTATGTVTDIGCESTGVSIGDTIDLVDTKNLLVGSSESLVGRTGEGFLMSQDGPYGADCVYKIWTLEGTQVECA